MKYLFLDGSCGISGDMTVAALLDLGANREKLNAAIEALQIEGLHVHAERKNSYSISGMDFEVHVHDHSADEVHVHEESYTEHSEHHHEHSEEHAEHHHDEHHHEHSHDAHGHHHHEHRHLSEVYAILDRVSAKNAATPRAMKMAKDIFKVIAEAEAKAHGVPIEEVHFHEVGAVDSIVDILSVAVLVDDLYESLNFDKCVVTGLNEGCGFVETQHGMLPIPVPAVANIAEAAGIALHITETKGEMVTPTGAGLVAVLRTNEKLPSNYKILKSGVGLGKRDFGHANFLRAQIIEEVLATGDSPNDRSVYIVECNIDDASPEELGLAMDKIFEAGARDVHFIPCFMKKNRPGIVLRAIVDGEKLSEVENSILRHTTTVGLRRIPVVRNCMSRSYADVETPFGMVNVKKCELGDIVKYKPEFDSVKEVAEKNRVPFREVFDAARSKAKF